MALGGGSWEKQRTTAKGVVNGSPYSSRMGWDFSPHQGPASRFYEVDSGPITDMFVDILFHMFPKATKSNGHTTAKSLSVSSYLGANNYYLDGF